MHANFTLLNIINGMPSIVNPCLYDIKGNRSGDHLGIYMTVDCIKPLQRKKEITFRRHCAISLPEFTKDIETSTTLQCTSATTDDLVDARNSGIKVLIEKHASLQRKIITLRPNAPWYTEELRESKQKRRKAERLCR